MPLAVLCPSCGKRSNAPDNALGRRAKCGKCGTSFIVSEAPPKAPPIAKAVKTSVSPSKHKQPPQSDIDDLLGSFPSANAAPDPHELDELLGTLASTPAAPKTKACPMCGETILETAKKCKHCGEMIDSQSLAQANKSKGKKGKNSDKRTTDPLAIVCFATGMLSLLILPIVFAPICYITGIVSYYRLRENPDLKGRWLRITGALCGVLSILYLLYQFEIGPFSNHQSELPDEPGAQVVAPKASPSQQMPVTTEASNDVAPKVTAAPIPTVDWIEEADKQLEDGENDKAAEAFGEAIKADPKSTKAVNGRGVAFLRLRKLGRALDDFTRAIELDPTESKFYSNRAIVFKDQEKYTRALADLTKAIELSPKNPQWYDERGSVYYNMDDEEQAEADWAVAKRLTSLKPTEIAETPPTTSLPARDPDAPPPIEMLNEVELQKTFNKVRQDEFFLLDLNKRGIRSVFRADNARQTFKNSVGESNDYKMCIIDTKYDFDRNVFNVQATININETYRHLKLDLIIGDYYINFAVPASQDNARAWSAAAKQQRLILNVTYKVRGFDTVVRETAMGPKTLFVVETDVIDAKMMSN
jgi:tetratricopeptide (TPR) repeat protein/predicted RNA-binding Zn-ribbon protein involved in translation (DUF1610 family)